jgi:hypothetical protein
MAVGKEALLVGSEHLVVGRGGGMVSVPAVVGF